MNKDEDGDGGTTRLAPPPKAMEMGLKPSSVEPLDAPQVAPHMNPSVDQQSPSLTNTSKLVTGSNMFKLQKNRNMRANYIDVMNPTRTKGNRAPSNLPTPVTSPLVPMAASSPQLFIPAPGMYSFFIFIFPS